VQQVPSYASAPASAPTAPDAPNTSAEQSFSSQDNLSLLASNYQNSLLHDHHGLGNAHDTGNAAAHDDSDPTPLSQMYQGDDILLELAMIPEFGESDGSPSDGLQFIDFPNEEVWPKR
jgi:hypothetical protein